MQTKEEIFELLKKNLDEAKKENGGDLSFPNASFLLETSKLGVLIDIRDILAER